MLVHATWYDESVDASRCRFDRVANDAGVVMSWSFVYANAADTQLLLVRL